MNDKINTMRNSNKLQRDNACMECGSPGKLLTKEEIATLSKDEKVWISSSIAYNRLVQLLLDKRGTSLYLTATRIRKELYESSISLASAPDRICISAEEMRILFDDIKDIPYRLARRNAIDDD